MFKNLKKKTKKISIGKKNQFLIFFFSSCPNFVCALYTLISPNLQIILKKNYILGLISKKHPTPTNIKKIGCKLKKWGPDPNSKNTICTLGVNV